jgi:ribonuclease HI
MTPKIIIHTDGGARGNPGPAAVGIVIEFTTKDVAENTRETIEIGKYIGETTNNVAEYTALLEALKKTREFETEEVECLLDSELVVKQLNGQYKVKEPNLQVLCSKVKTEAKFFKKITFRHIPRVLNKRADKIVNEVLDSQNAK